MEEELLVVDGFVFPSYKEAQIALQEHNNIDIIRQRTPLSDGQAVFDLYTKIIERDVFKTIVGYSFLYELRCRLIMEFQYDENDLVKIVLPKRMEYDKVSEFNKGVLENKLKKEMIGKKRMAIVIAALAIMVVAMFIIAAINPNAGYINIENKVLNKYAAWQEELDKREAVIKEREEELNINID